MDHESLLIDKFSLKLLSSKLLELDHLAFFRRINPSLTQLAFYSLWKSQMWKKWPKSTVVVEED